MSTVTNPKSEFGQYRKDVELKPHQAKAMLYIASKDVVTMKELWNEGISAGVLGVLVRRGYVVELTTGKSQFHTGEARQWSATDRGREFAKNG